MKKILIASAGMLLTSVFFSTTSFSQHYAYHNPFPQSTMISFMSADNEAEKNVKSISIDNNVKLQKRFTQRFKNAQNVQWYPVKNSFLAVFDNEGRKTRALFTKNGYNIYDIAYGNEKDLPNDYRRTLKSMYVDYEITNAVEIKSSSVLHTTWLANLKDENNIVIARIVDGGVDEFAHYKTKPNDLTKKRKGRVIIHKASSKNGSLE